MHLTVISYLRDLDPQFEKVALVAVDLGKSHRFVRCQRPAQLLNTLAGLPARVGVLDLHGHGAPGRMHLGDELLVDTRPRTWRVLEELEPFLTPDARIRLLGCGTGAKAEGLRLLRGLSSVLGGRRVLGTRAELNARDFGPSGLRRTVASRWLVSSELEAPVPLVRRRLLTPRA